MKVNLLPVLLTSSESLGRPLGLSLFLHLYDGGGDGSGGDICSVCPQSSVDAQAGKWM